MVNERRRTRTQRTHRCRLMFRRVGRRQRPPTRRPLRRASKRKVSCARSDRLRRTIVPVRMRLAASRTGRRRPRRNVRRVSRAPRKRGAARSGPGPAAPPAGGGGAVTPEIRATLLTCSSETQSVLFGPVVICRGPPLRPPSVVRVPPTVRRPSEKGFEANSAVQYAPSEPSVIPNGSPERFVFFTTPPWMRPTCCGTAPGFAKAASVPGPAATPWTMPPTLNGVNVPAFVRRMTRPGALASATQTKPLAASMSLPLRPATVMGVEPTGLAAGLILKTVLAPVVQRLPSDPRAIASPPTPVTVSRSPVLLGSEGEKLPIPLVSVVQSLPPAEAIPPMVPMLLGSKVVTAPAGVILDTSVLPYATQMFPSGPCVRYRGMLGTGNCPVTCGTAEAAGASAAEASALVRSASPKRTDRT